MVEPINLNKARKARDKDAAKVRAAENRVRFGRGKPEREIAALEADKARRDLDGKKRED